MPTQQLKFNTYIVLQCQFSKADMSCNYVGLFHPDQSFIPPPLLPNPINSYYELCVFVGEPVLEFLLVDLFISHFKVTFFIC